MPLRRFTFQNVHARSVRSCTDSGKNSRKLISCIIFEFELNTLKSFTSPLWFSVFRLFQESSDLTDAVNKTFLSDRRSVDPFPKCHHTKERQFEWNNFQCFEMNRSFLAFLENKIFRSLSGPKSIPLTELGRCSDRRKTDRLMSGISSEFPFPWGQILFQWIHFQVVSLSHSCPYFPTVLEALTNEDCRRVQLNATVKFLSYQEVDFVRTGLQDVYLEASFDGLWTVLLPLVQGRFSLSLPTFNSWKRNERLKIRNWKWFLKILVGKSIFCSIKKSLKIFDKKSNLKWIISTLSRLGLWKSESEKLFLKSSFEPIRTQNF